MPDIPSLVYEFDRDGFVVVESLLGSARIDALARGVEWALATQQGHPWIKPRSYEWFEKHPIFVELIEHPLVMEFAEKWLGRDHHLIAAQCSRNTSKDPYAPGAMQWHKDDVFFPASDRYTPGVPLDRYSFSAMWYVQDTPLEMGPTELLPGSQSLDTVPGDDTLASSSFWQPIRAGSLLIFNNRTLHRGRPNTTATPRDLVTNAYARPEVDKVQLTQPGADNAEVYVEPTVLTAKGGHLARLLKQR